MLRYSTKVDPLLIKGFTASSFLFWFQQTPTPDTFLPLEPSSWASHGIHGLPHQLLEQPYSQQTKLLKQRVDVNSYQNFPQDYGPIPFHHSPGSIRHGLPQYKRDDLARNVAMSDLGSSVFGSLQGSNTLLGDFLPSPTVASNLSAVGYKDMLQNQIIKDPNHFPPQGLVRIPSFMFIFLF